MAAGSYFPACLDYRSHHMRRPVFLYRGLCKMALENTMTIYQWLWFSLIYLLAGQVFSLVYSIQFRNEKRTAWLGLMGLFFPLYLLIDLVVTLASGLGAHVPTLLAKIDRKDNPHGSS